jgi:S1-C subfamily serine protease
MYRRRHSLLAVVFLAGAAPLAAQPVRVEARTTLPRDSAREASTQRVFRQVERSTNPEDLLRIVLEMQGREQRLLAELQATSTGETAVQRRLMEELGYLNRERFGVLSIVESRCAAERGPRPAGYLGLNLESDADPVTREIRFTIVQTVDPGSPAERAGILPGDTLLALGGRDVRGREPDASGLLEPGKRFAVRVARGAEVKELMVTVAPRPAGIARSCGEFERVLQPLRVATPTRFMYERERRGDEPRRLAVGTAPAQEPVASMQLFIIEPAHLSAPASPFFAGAQFRVLDDDWRGLLNLKPDVQGVFVNEVMPGTLSAQAGLRKGDVVLSVGDSPATSPMTLVKLLIVTERPDASLSVLRGGEKRTLVLRLPPR